MRQQRKLGLGLCVAALSAAVGVGIFSSTARSADDDAKTPSAPAAGDAAGAAGHQMSAEDMKKMMEMAQPGPEHKHLEQLVGTWDADGKMLMPPGGSTKGTMTMKMIMGGRYLQMNVDATSEMGGQSMPFHGQGLQGYDRAKKKYFGTWIDDMGTGIMTSEGTYDGDTLTMEGSFTDPMSGKECKTHEVMTLKDKDHVNYEMSMSQDGSPMTKVMEISYTRKS